MGTPNRETDMEAMRLKLKGELLAAGHDAEWAERISRAYDLRRLVSRHGEAKAMRMAMANWSCGPQG